MQAPSTPSRVDPFLDQVLARHGADPFALVQILRDAQARHGWLPPATITYLASRLGMPRAHVEGVAGFYAFLYTAPAGRYRVLFADNIVERLAGSEALLERLCSSLWIERGKLSEDGLVSVDTTSCIGMSDQPPSLLVNGRAIARLTAEGIDAIAELIREQVPLDAWPAPLFAIDDNIRREDALLRSRLEPGEALRASIARGQEQPLERAGNERSWRELLPALPQGPALTLEEIKRSNLRGRGGAGFMTGLKWEACRTASGPLRHVVCNADEGEPGTFKDRVLLARHADLAIEGMTVCAYVIGASSGFLYLRGEYEYLLDPLKATLARRRAAGLLGRGIAGVAGFDFDIAIHVGAGAYVCGEESALIAGRPARHPAQPAAVPGHARLSPAADRRQQRRDILRRCADRKARRRLVPGAGHGEVRGHEDPLRVRRLRATGHLRVPVRRHRPASTGGLRSAELPGSAGLWAVGDLHRRRRVRPAPGFRGPADCRCVHGV
jgi:[NiFe] hydrogenase diaphorase moiety large subunit